MDSRNTKVTINGSAQRKCQSWIESFVEWSSGHEAPEIYRKWAAITTIGAALEQKVFATTRSGKVHPNLYCMLVGPPGVGKSIAISAAARYARGLPDLNVGPISMTGASLVDAVAGATRTVQDFINGHASFNSMFLMPDDLQALLSKYDQELVANLTIFYDTTPYIQTRRSLGPEPIKINSPQLSILGGTTPSHLLDMLPPGAWDQGFMSRTIMIYSQDKPMHDDIFGDQKSSDNQDLHHDLHCIFNLKGQYALADKFRNAINDWRKGGLAPAPNHPRLVHYGARRVVHLLKLAIISSADRGDSLQLDMYDYARAHQWLVDAERVMPNVFSGPATLDARAMQEIQHLCRIEVPEAKLIRLTAERVPTHAVRRTIDLMVDSGMLKVRLDSKNLKWFKAVPE